MYDIYLNKLVSISKKIIYFIIFFNFFLKLILSFFSYILWVYYIQIYSFYIWQ